MDSVQRVKMICKERKIAVSKLEKSCGFSNGYLNSLTKGKIPYDKMVKISKFLDVSIDYIADGIETNIVDSSYEIADVLLDAELLDKITKLKSLSKDDIQLVYNMIESLYKK